MIYRRFGRTELRMPVLTCGGMRYQASWNADETDKITDDGQANLAATLKAAIDAGITHIETARGYGTSELQIGRALSGLPRDKIILQTKIGPAETGDEFAAHFEQSLQRLGVERVDLLSIHGINDEAALERTLRPGGPLDVAERQRRLGRVGHVGFSTHGATRTILDAIATGRFDYVNLHWYWIFQDNWPAVIEARRRDMGVFIISPNDKGGRLYEPSETLRDLCHPLSPMAWNDLFCLLRGEVHTLSIGAARPDDFDEHIAAVRRLGDPRTIAQVAEITRRIEQRCLDRLGRTWCESWHEGVPQWRAVPGQVNIRVIVWLWNLVQSLDLDAYARARYGLLGNGGHWFPGNKAAEMDRDAIRRALADSPHRDRILDVLAEADDLFGGQDVKRLQTK